MRRGGIVLALLLAGLGAAAQQAAALDVGGRVVVAADIPGAAAAPDPVAAYDATLDRFIVVWLAATPDNETVNVWARFVTPDGELVGEPFRAAVLGTGLERRHVQSVTATYDPLRREYLLLLTGLRNASLPGEVELYAQWLDDGGGPIGEVRAISRVSAGAVGRPALAHDVARDRFVVAYELQRPWMPSPSVAVQAFRRGEIPDPSLPFAGSLATHPQVAVTGRGVVLAAVTGGSQTTLTSGLLAPDFGSLTINGRLLLERAPNAGPMLRWHPSMDRGMITWGTQAGTTLVSVDPNGGLASSSAATLPDDARRLGVLSLPREERWMVIAHDHTLTAAELTTSGGLLARATISGGEPPPFGALTLGAANTGAGAVDSVRSWALVPYAVRSERGPAILARIVAPSPPTAATAPAPGTRATPRCSAGNVLFLPPSGSLCGPPAVKAFTVAPLTDRRKRTLLGVVVRPTVAGQRVRVECVAACGRLRPVLSVRGRRAATQVRFGSWRLPRAARIEVRVEDRDATTRFRRFGRSRTFPFLTVRGTAGCRLPIGIETPC